MAGMTVAIIGFGISSSLGAVAVAFNALFGTFLMIAYTLSTIGSDVKELLRRGLLFSAGVLLVAYVTKDIVSILVTLYAIFFLGIRLAIKWNIPYYIQEFISVLRSLISALRDLIDKFR